MPSSLLGAGRRNQVTRSVVLLDLGHLKNLIGVAAFGLLQPGPMNLESVANFDARRVPLERVRLAIAGLQFESIGSGEDAAFEVVMAVVNCDRNRDGGGDAHTDGNSAPDHFSVAGANIAGGTARGRGGSGAEQDSENRKRSNAEAAICEKAFVEGALGIRRETGWKVRQRATPLGIAVPIGARRASGDRNGGPLDRPEESNSFATGVGGRSR